MITTDNNNKGGDFGIIENSLEEGINLVIGKIYFLHNRKEKKRKKSEKLIDWIITNNFIFYSILFFGLLT